MNYTKDDPNFGEACLVEQSSQFAEPCRMPRKLHAAEVWTCLGVVKRAHRLSYKEVSSHQTSVIIMYLEDTAFILATGLETLHYTLPRKLTIKICKRI
jgi:isocitrate dehydrogenase kinase/phosphatase